MEKSIFKAYTGNAMLNQALMTVEAIKNLKDVSEITSDVMLGIFREKRFWQLYRRMKNYTMLFTKNGPLHNDAKIGDQVYKGLIESILKNVETKGKYRCEVSGLYFETPFNIFYENALKSLNVDLKDIAKKDKTINRCWFPLIGGLGSDAQALPQAKFEVRIHPVCVALMQFLPLSSFIYKGGIFLFDSANFDFAKSFIQGMVEIMSKRIEVKNASDEIENVKDFNKGDYIQQSIQIFNEKINDYSDTDTDINLWSFSNAGTGARCEIDRIPSVLFKDLLKLWKYDCRTDLQMLLKLDTEKFLEALKSKTDFWALYPTEKRAGVGIVFFEEYQKLIGKSQLLPYARYVSGLISKATLSKTELKMLEKPDAYSDKEYPAFLNKILIDATQNDNWSLEHQLKILDNTEGVSIRNSSWGFYKKVHFYFLNKIYATEMPQPSAIDTTEVGRLCLFAVKMVEKDDKLNKSLESLTDRQDYSNFSFAPVLIRNTEGVTLSQIHYYYFPNYYLTNNRLNELLRFYFLQPNKIGISTEMELPAIENPFLLKFENFAEFYKNYYLEKYKNDWLKFQKHVLTPFPTEGDKFLRWFEEAFIRMREFYKENHPEKSLSDLSVWEQSLIYDEEGNKITHFSRFAIQFYLNQIFQNKNNSILTH